MRRRKSRPVLIFRALPFLMLVSLAFWTIDSAMRPAVESMSTHQAILFATQSVNDAMLRELSQNGVAYSDIITITHNSAGEVTAVSTNVTEIARLQTRLTQGVLEELAQQEISQVQIPLGTLFGEQIFSGRGPLITIRIVPVGSVQTYLSNEFIGAGINQTLHRIMLVTEMQIQTIFPGYTVTTDTITKYSIAETIIVGQVPEGFTVITGDDRHIISQINDYMPRLD